MSKYDKWYIIGKLLCSTFRICKKISNLQKFNFLSQNPVSENVCKKNFQKMENFTFLKSPRLCHLNISIYSNIFKILKNLIFNKETKNVQISFAFFSQKLMQSFPMSKAFQKAKFYQNLTSGSGSKQSFSLSIQAACLRTQAVSIKTRF